MVSSEIQPYLINLFIDKFKEQAVHLHFEGLSLEFSNGDKI